MFKEIILIGIIILSLTSFSLANVVILKNGDRITGDIIETGADFIKVKTMYMGDVSIKNVQVDKIMTNDEAAAPYSVPKVWQNTVSAGYNKTNGNTKTTGVIFNEHSVYTKGKNVVDIKSSYEYDSSDGRMTVQKAYGKIENDYTLDGPNSKWFNTRSIEIDHDKFSDISYRILPQIGIGYWFWKNDESKFEVDDGIGYEYTKWNTPYTKSVGNMADVAHLYVDKLVFWKSKLSEDFTFYPSLS